MLLDAAYVGSTGSSLYRAINLNQLQPGTVQKNPGININDLRPYRGFANIVQYITGSNSNYNALQVSWRYQMKGGGLFNLSYTWSKAIDDASAFNAMAMNSFNYKLDRGPSDFNRTQIFVLSYVYPLPFWRSGHLWYQKAFGGWQLAGVTSLETGLPLNLVLPSDVAGTGASGERPNLVGDPGAGNIKTTMQWFNKAAFALPAAGSYGNLGRNALTGPGLNNWEASLHKMFALSERLQMQLRWEVYNAPQHFSYWGVATTVNAGNFGQVTGATDPRTMQLGLRLEF